MIDRIIQDQEIKAAKELIDASSDIVVIAHTSPDGDAIGSVLGMWHWLKIMGKNARMVMPDELPSGFEWMPDVEKILIHRLQNEEGDKLISEADLIICLDLNEPKRLGSAQQAFLNSKAKRLLVDHHLYPADSWDVCVSYPDMSSACEVLYRLIYQMDAEDKIDAVTASCIYTGLMTDTGNFSYSSNDVELYYIIAALMKKGIDKEQIYRNVFNNAKESQLRLRGHLLKDNMMLYPESHAAIITLTEKEKIEYSYQKGDTEGVVNEPMRIKGIDVSVFISQDKGKVKISLRSTGDIPVNKVATKYFGGGGHKNAAGGEVYYISIEQVRKKVEQVLPEIWAGRGSSE